MVERDAGGGVAEGRPLVASPAVWTAAGCAVALVVLAAGVAIRWSLPWTPDVAWEPVVHAWVLERPTVIGVARVVTDLGSPVAMDVLTVVLAVGAWLLHRRGAAVAVVVVRLAELLLETGVKAIVDRPRPVFDPPLATASASSFPSGHSAGTAAVVGLLVVVLIADVRRRTRRPVLITVAALVCCVFVVAVAASRVALGVHYPSDVVGGLLLGVTCVAMAWVALTVRAREAV